jgi:hypothetical protein
MLLSLGEVLPITLHASRSSQIAMLSANRPTRSVSLAIILYSAFSPVNFTLKEANPRIPVFNNEAPFLRLYCICGGRSSSEFCPFGFNVAL